MNSERVWNRSTAPFGSRESRAWHRLGIEDPHEILGDKATQNPGANGAASATGTRRLPPKERKALEILGARDTWTRPDIRKQYKSLVKDLHPDMNGGNRADEDRLQEVVWAWAQIKDSRGGGAQARETTRGAADTGLAQGSSGANGRHSTPSPSKMQSDPAGTASQVQLSVSSGSDTTARPPSSASHL